MERPTARGWSSQATAVAGSRPISGSGPESSGCARHLEVSVLPPSGLGLRAAYNDVIRPAFPAPIQHVHSGLAC
jgi:hypothetical protein